jgi:hypothetical protein
VYTVHYKTQRFFTAVVNVFKWLLSGVGLMHIGDVQRKVCYAHLHQVSLKLCLFAVQMHCTLLSTSYYSFVHVN